VKYKTIDCFLFISTECLHLVYSHHRISTREKVKLVHHMKQNLIGEKFLWFRDHLVPDVVKYTPELILNIIEL
jgi:hypothetical protein